MKPIPKSITKSQKGIDF